MGFALQEKATVVAFFHGGYTWGDESGGARAACAQASEV